MVYTGKPSTACGTCRQRRIKCDEARPTCSQCIKSKRECTGYRSESDLLFRDQTERTELRLRQQNSAQERGTLHARARLEPESGPSLKRRAVASSNPESVSINEVYDTGWDPVPRSLPEFHEHQALCYFITEYVIMPEHQGKDRGYLEFVLPLYIGARSQNPLLASTAATSLAIYSKKTGQEWLMTEAMSFYGSAVALTTKALNDPIEVKSDHTLMAVMLLSLFETFTATEETFPVWGRHTDGAVALVKERGKEMLANPISSKLLSDVCNQMVIRQVSRCEPVEEAFHSLESWGFCSSNDTQSIANRLTVITTQIPALKHTGKRLLQNCPMDWATARAITALMAEAQRVDCDLASWSLDLPSSWRYTIVSECSQMDDPQRAQLYPGSIHGYPDLWVARHWNIYRTYRILCQGIILNCLERLIPASELKSTEEYSRATSILQKMVDDICASVPFHLGYPDSIYAKDSICALFAEDFSRDDYDLPKFGLQVDDRSRNTRAIGGYFLLWQLFVAETVVTIPKIQRAWIVNRLKHIGASHGLSQATVLARHGLRSLEGGRKFSITDFAPARDLAWEIHWGPYWRPFLRHEPDADAGADSA